MTTFTNDFSREIYEQTYRMGDEDINATQKRVANYLASIEKDPKYSAEFLWALENFKFVPGGRITSNAGLDLQGTTLINCFVSAPEGEDIDSMAGIHRELGNQMMILKCEGGYGFCASFMRPRGSFVEGIANFSPGAVEMLNIWDASSSTITAGPGTQYKNKKAKGKIRKGAQMVTLHCWHPDICEFVLAKQQPGRLTKFNMSVLITDSFMDAVKNNKAWNLEYPDYSYSLEVKEKYKKIWDGDLAKWKDADLPVKIYQSYENANELYNIIMESTFNRNEPGVLFIDTINKLNNLYYCESIKATNPCGEQALPPGGVCLLGSINLTQFVLIEKQDWNYIELQKIIPIIVRMLDNVNDLTLVPLDIQRWNLVNKRRIGLGILGYGSALMILKIRYGSEQALKMTDELMKFISDNAYRASVELAKEKGKFPLFDTEKYTSGNFIQTLDPEVRKLIAKHGIRNSHLLSIQPTGNSSVYANNVSGGLEPIWQPISVRTSNMPQHPEGMHLPTNIDWMSKKATMNGTVWTWKKEGDENLLYTNFSGHIWKIDKSRGLLRETEVVDYAVHVLRQREEWDPNADWVATVPTLTIDEHLKTMKVFSKYIDSSMSKTVNLPKNYRFNAFKKLYIDAYDTGTIKGVTTYREGTMAYVLSSIDKPADIVPSRGAPPRPKELYCDIHIVSFKRVRHIVLVGMMNGKPFEVFSFQEKNVRFTNKLKNGILIKTGSGKYTLETETIILDDLNKNFDRCEESLITRLISLSLRNGVSINDIYEQLNKSGDMVASFSRVIARTLSRYVTGVQGKQCSNCESPNGLLFQEGCITCRDCGWAKCE
jgi:ribonucleoside-diphosphate reductase alpha chain